MCIISTAQQARPKVNGQIDPLRPQLSKSSRRATAHSPTLDCLVPKGEYFLGGGGFDSSTTGKVAIDLTAGAPKVPGGTIARRCPEVKARRSILQLKYKQNILFDRIFR
uniref:Uncharacterized protein n=1 Tax=Phlebotomus papatasi TaxID=29031 RepID=A0A1B0GMZ6_PHLPP